MRKRLNSLSNENTSADRPTENPDLDSFSQYTLEVDHGIKILDTTPAINRKAIFNDLDRLRRWKESVDNPSKEVFVSDDEQEDATTTNDSLNALNEVAPTTLDNKADIDMDYILNSLPDVANFDGGLANNLNCYGKLNQLEHQVNFVDNNLFSIGTTSNTQKLIPTLGLSPVDKKGAALEDDSEIIINEIIVNDRTSEDVDDISNLNRKNSGVGDVGGSGGERGADTSDMRETLKTIDISDELDSLFDDIDEGLELPDVPDHDICSYTADQSLPCSSSYGNEEQVNNNNNNDTNFTPDTAAVVNASISSNYISSGPAVDCVDLSDTPPQTGSKGKDTESIPPEDHLNVQRVISSTEETDSVDAFIDYVETITGGSSSNNNNDNDDDEELLVNDKGVALDLQYEDDDIANDDLDDTIDSGSSILRSTSLIEGVLDHIETSESTTERTEHLDQVDIVNSRGELEDQCETYSCATYMADTQDVVNVSAELEVVDSGMSDFTLMVEFSLLYFTKNIYVCFLKFENYSKRPKGYCLNIVVGLLVSKNYLGNIGVEGQNQYYFY